MAPSPQDPHVLLLTLERHPAPDEEVVLALQGKEVSRGRFQLLDNRDTGQLHVYKPDATWADACSAVVSLRRRFGD